jgi:hypothetical protein
MLLRWRLAAALFKPQLDEPLPSPCLKRGGLLGDQLIERLAAVTGLDRDPERLSQPESRNGDLVRGHHANLPLCADEGHGITLHIAGAIRDGQIQRSGATTWGHSRSTLRFESNACAVSRARTVKPSAPNGRGHLLLEDPLNRAVAAHDALLEQRRVAVRSNDREPVASQLARAARDARSVRVAARLRRAGRRSVLRGSGVRRGRAGVVPP